MTFVKDIYTNLKFVLDGTKTLKEVNDSFPKGDEDSLKLLNVTFSNFVRYEYFIKKFDKNISLEIIILLAIYYANKESDLIAQKEVIDYLTYLVKEFDYKIDLDFVIKKINEIDSVKEMEKLKVNPSLYVSLKYNLKDWQANMLTKQFGLENVEKIFNSELKPSLKKRIDMKMVDYVKCAPFENVLLYLDENDTIYIPLLNKHRADIISSPGKDFYEINKNLMRQNLSIRCNLYESDTSSLKSVVSKKMNHIICLPRSTKLYKLLLEKDQYLNVHPIMLDECCINDLKVLDDLSNFVEDEGYLYYFVPTISKKETTLVIDTFLKKHQDFVLEFDRQHIPSEKENILLYAAILKKKAKDE